jgi:lipoate-protein ligase A
MAQDELLLEQLANEPILHLYEWQRPSLTFGYFIEPNKFLNLDALARHGIDMARRPTGGGVVFHIWDLAFSFLMPSSHPRYSETPLENYRFVNSVVLAALQSFLKQAQLLPATPIKPEVCRHFCMAQPTQYDVVWQGRKVAGSAQRKKKQGYLHQGTIAIHGPDIGLLHELVQDKLIWQSIETEGFLAHVPLTEARQQVTYALKQAFVDKLG